MKHTCELCGKVVGSESWDIHTCTPKVEQPAQPQAYKQANPLGGPAKVFDAMADAIRAGDDYHAVLRQYGFAEQTAQQEFVCSTGLCHYRKPLTNEQIESLFEDGLAFEHYTKVVREIEAAHGIKV